MLFGFNFLVFSVSIFDIFLSLPQYQRALADVSHANLSSVSTSVMGSFEVYFLPDF